MPDQGTDALPRQRREIERRAPGIGRPLDLLQPFACEREEIGGRRGADHRQQSAARIETARVEAERILALEGLHVAAEPVRRVAVRMLRAVPERHHRSRSHAGRLVEIALQGRQRAPPRGGDFPLRKGRLERDLQQGIQCLPCQIAGNRERQGRFVERDLDAQARAHALDQYVHAARVTPHRSAAQQIGGELREARLSARVFRRASGHREPHVKQRNRAPLDRHECQAGRLLRDFEGRQRDVADHASAPSGSSPGTSVTRFRRCGAKVVRATRWISAGLIAW